MYVVTWTYPENDRRPSRWFLAKEKHPDGTTTMLNLADEFETVERAASAAVILAVSEPELIGRLEVRVLKYREREFGKMESYLG